MGEQAVTVTSNQRVERLSDTHAVGSGCLHAAEKKPDPTFPVSKTAYGIQTCVVLFLVPFQGQTEVEQGLGKQAPMLQ